MRALAEFIMRGRWQAALVAALGSLLPFISQGAVGLVTLRKGVSEGILVLLWAALPLIVTGFVSDAGVVITVASLAALGLTIVAAQVLKTSVSWSTTLVVSLLGSCLIALVISQGFDAQLLQIEQDVATFFTEAMQQVEPTSVVEVTRTLLLGVIGYVVLVNVLISLLLSRWWQAILYNPGGFKAEMHQLQIGFYPAIVLLLAAVACYSTSSDYLSWATLLAMPLMVGGLCLAHFCVAAKRLGLHWLVLLYVGVVMFGPLSLILVAVGFADSMLNLRSKIPVKGNS